MSRETASEIPISKMSGELTTCSTKGQNSALTGSITLPDFNLSLHIHITATPALHVALERIAEALKPVSEPVFYGLNVEQTSELIEKEVVNSAMTGLDSSQKDSTPADKIPVKHVPK
ncbi:MAG: hypothetical protein QUS12_04575, partial [Methanosarcina sp.]|nr:hypothetical protein [Methanosarcina sp.]